MTMDIRPLIKRDLSAVSRLDARLTGERKTPYWRDVFCRYVNASNSTPLVGLAAEHEGKLVGYLLGEVRAVEFGSDACGWIFAVGVDPANAQHGVGSALVTEACVRFRAAGVTTVRTMVRRNDVPMLSFFRSNAFVGGAYVQLETHVSQE
jgi:ribosomal protein S18 acetylase RimI-like enzyme